MIEEYNELHPSVVILNQIFGVFRLDSNSTQNFSLLSIPFKFTNSTESTDSETKIEYGLNNILLPLIIIAIWTVSLLTISIVKKFKCCWRTEFFRLGGKPPTTSSPSLQNDDLITIVSNDKMWVRGAVEDKVRFEVLQRQMRRIRRFFSFLVLLGVLTSVLDVGSSLLLKGIYDGIVDDVHGMTYRLGVAESSMESIKIQSNLTLQIKGELITMLGSVDLKGCMVDYQFLQDAATDLASRLEDLHEQLNHTQLDEAQEMFLNGKVVSQGIEQHLRSFFYPMWIIVSSAVMFDVASLLLLWGTSIARRDAKRRWHQLVFQHISFSLLICSSIVLLLNLLSLVLGGMAVTDFCSFDGNGGIVSDTVLSVLDARGYSDTSFFDMAERVLMNDCNLTTVPDMVYTSVVRGLVEAEKMYSLLPSAIKNTCPVSNAFSLRLKEFIEATNTLLYCSYETKYVSQCDDLRVWYTDLAFEKTCSAAPTYLSLSLAGSAVLLLLSVIMAALGVSWRTNTDLFIEVSYAKHFDAKKNANNYKDNIDRDGTLSRQQRSSIRIESARTEGYFSNGDEYWSSRRLGDVEQVSDRKEVSNNDAIRKQGWISKLFKTRQKRNEVKRDILNQINAQLGTVHSRIVGNMNYYDDPEEQGEVELSLNYSNDDDEWYHRALWINSDGNKTSDHFYFSNDNNSILAESSDLNHTEMYPRDSSATDRERGNPQSRSGYYSEEYGNYASSRHDSSPYDSLVDPLRMATQEDEYSVDESRHEDDYSIDESRNEVDERNQIHGPSHNSNSNYLQQHGDPSRVQPLEYQQHAQYTIHPPFAFNQPNIGHVNRDVYDEEAQILHERDDSAPHGNRQRPPRTQLDGFHSLFQRRHYATNKLQIPNVDKQPIHQQTTDPNFGLNHNVATPKTQIRSSLYPQIHPSSMPYYSPAIPHDHDNMLDAESVDTKTYLERFKYEQQQQQAQQLYYTQGRHHLPPNYYMSTQGNIAKIKEPPKLSLEVPNVEENDTTRIRITAKKKNTATSKDIQEDSNPHYSKKNNIQKKKNRKSTDDSSQERREEEEEEEFPTKFDSRRQKKTASSRNKRNASHRHDKLSNSSSYSSNENDSMEYTSSDDTGSTSYYDESSGGGAGDDSGDSYSSSYESTSLDDDSSSRERIPSYRRKSNSRRKRESSRRKESSRSRRKSGSSRNRHKSYNSSRKESSRRKTQMRKR